MPPADPAPQGGPAVPAAVGPAGGPGQGVLSGTRVLSLAINVPGPVAAARLVALGAQVHTLQPPSGDPLRLVCPGWYDELHAAMTVETADLKTASGRDRLEHLLEQADVLLVSSRPSALARLDLVPDELVTRHARLVVVSIVGEAGPGAERAGHDLTYAAAAGLVKPPELPRTLLADLAGAAETVQAVLAGLLHRASTGAGSVIEVSLTEAVAGLAAPRRHGLTAAGGALGGGWPLYDVYPAADGGWVAVAALEEHFARRLLGELGLDAPDRENLTAVLATRTAEEWERWALERDLPLAALRSAAAATASPR